MHRDAERVTEGGRGHHADSQAGERARPDADDDGVDVRQRHAGLRARGEHPRQEQLTVLAGVVGDPNGAGSHRIRGHLDHAGRHCGRRGVQGEHEHNLSLSRVLRVPGRALRTGRPPVDNSAPSGPVPAGNRRTGHRRWPHDTPHPPVRGARPDPGRVRPSAHRGRALAGRPRPAHRPGPLRADLRGDGRRVRRPGLAHPVDTHGRLPRAALRHPELVLAAPLPLATRGGRGDVGVVRLPCRHRPARPRQRPTGGAAQAAAVLRRPRRARAAADRRRAGTRRVRVPSAVPGDRAAAQPAGPAVRVQRAQPGRRSAVAGR